MHMEKSEMGILQSLGGKMRSQGWCRPWDGVEEGQAAASGPVLHRDTRVYKTQLMRELQDSASWSMDRRRIREPQPRLGSQSWQDDLLFPLCCGVGCSSLSLQQESREGAGAETSQALCTPAALPAPTAHAAFQAGKERKKRKPPNTTKVERRKGSVVAQNTLQFYF